MQAVQQGESNDNCTAIRSGCCWDRTLRCPMQLEPEPRSPSPSPAARAPQPESPSPAARRSLTVPAHLRGSTQLQHITILALDQMLHYMTRDTHLVTRCLADIKQKRITGCGSPFPAFTAYVCPHTSNWAPVCELGLRLDRGTHPAMLLNLPVKECVLLSSIHSSRAAPTLTHCRSARSAPQRLLLEPRAHDGAGSRAWVRGNSAAYRRLRRFDFSLSG